MGTMLNEREAEFVNTLMKRDRKRMRLGWLFMMLLVVGGLIIVITIFLTLRGIKNHDVLWLVIPGFVLGLSLIGLAVAGVSWVKQQHLIVSVLTKLQQPAKRNHDMNVSEIE